MYNVFWNDLRDVVPLVSLVDEVHVVEDVVDMLAFPGVEQSFLALPLVHLVALAAERLLVHNVDFITYSKQQ